MMYQFIWSELVEPSFTGEEKLAYVEMANSFGPWCQIYPIGNVVNGRRLFHGLGGIGLCNVVIDFLTTQGSDPKLISIANQAGIAYGYKSIQTGVDSDEIPVYATIRDENIEELIPIGLDDPELYFQPILSVDEAGNPITIQIPKHSFAGWDANL